MVMSFLALEALGLHHDWVERLNLLVVVDLEAAQVRLYHFVGVRGGLFNLQIMQEYH